jgi:hypothetical protein
MASCKRRSVEGPAGNGGGKNDLCRLLASGGSARRHQLTPHLGNLGLNASARYLGSCLYLGLRPIAILLLHGGSPGVGDGKNSVAVVGLSFIHLPSRAGISVPFFVVFVLSLLLARKLSRSRQRDPRT